MLGTKAYVQLLLEGVLKEGGYLAQNTKVGWIICGKGEEDSTVSNTKRVFVCRHKQEEKEETDVILKKFWEMEEAPRKKKRLTKEEMKCEEVFKKSYRRLDDGRPQVRLPFKENPSENLGQSRNQAVARWLAMEKKFEKDGNLKSDYMKAIREHWELDRVNTSERDHKVLQKDGSVKYSCYYIPHHAVIRNEIKTTKTRIVFDASAKTSSGKSLNEILMVGPTIQETLIIRLMKWRMHRIALRGDITKMYRQVKVYDEDVNYQRMVFRFHPTDPIEDFCLNTLTFGTASAPYMATRTLRQLAIDGENKYPVGSRVVKNDFHVDDLLTGADTVDAVKTVWKEVREMLAEAKFPMRKWASNSKEVIREIPTEECEFQPAEITNEDTLKALGIGWSPMNDYFFFNAPKLDTSKVLTKRVFLSQAAKLFDPLGGLGPVVLQPKKMFQKIWKQELKWDDEIPIELANRWKEFQRELPALERIRMPRWLGWSKDLAMELHCFSDASKQAYGAVIYIKATNEVGNSTVELVLAKSSVAPVQTVTLPRLELCGVVLLADIVSTVKRELQVSKSYCWTDSTITLDWINSAPDKHKTFVANRIAEIQEVTEQREWRHVDGTENPADCLSRGLNPKVLVSHPLWWHGPKWLKLSEEQWPKNPKVASPVELLELKGKKSLLTTKAQLNDVQKNLLSRYNSFTKLVRVSARIRTLKKKSKPKQLSLGEINDERMFWIRTVQSVNFSEELPLLRMGRELRSSSKLLQFNPFVDGNGVLRVGGRLKEALVDYDKKHPIIIPKNSILSNLIINDAHEITKHGGTQLTMTYIRTQYWIIDTQRMVRNQIHKCVTCHRYSKKMQTQLMGTLPDQRINMSRAFLHSGVNYAGPVQVLTRKKPGKREVTKGYVAVFVCLCTKAIHLELVSDMSSERFLAAFARFYGRRGLPSDMYSDNSKTFIGANNEMSEDLTLIKEVFEPQAADVMVKDNVRWHFIPPHAPHWGGIWEAGAKSMKHHVRRVMGQSIYTFEEIFSQ